MLATYQNQWIIYYWPSKKLLVRLLVSLVYPSDCRGISATTSCCLIHVMFTRTGWWMKPTRCKLGIYWSHECCPLSHMALSQMYKLGRVHALFGWPVPMNSERQEMLRMPFTETKRAFGMAAYLSVRLKWCLPFAFGVASCKFVSKPDKP